MKKGLFKQILKGIGLGIVDSVPVLSSIKNNIANPHLSTEENPLQGMGKIDYTRLITTLSITGLIAFYVLGKISLDDLKYFIDLIK